MLLQKKIQPQRKGKSNLLFLLALQLAICIERKHQSIEEFQDCLGSQDPESPRDEVTTFNFFLLLFQCHQLSALSKLHLVVDLEEILNWQDDGSVSEDFSIMQTPGENFDGKCDR